MSTGHPDRCVCGFCAEMRAKTMPWADWKAKHAPHLHRRGGEEFEREPYPHPSGTWAWIVCPCGAKLLTIGNVDG